MFRPFRDHWPLPPGDEAKLGHLTVKAWNSSLSPDTRRWVAKRLGFVGPTVPLLGVLGSLIIERAAMDAQIDHEVKIRMGIAARQGQPGGANTGHPTEMPQHFTPAAPPPAHAPVVPSAMNGAGHTTDEQRAALQDVFRAGR